MVGILPERFRHESRLPTSQDTSPMICPNKKQGETNLPSCPTRKVSNLKCMWEQGRFVQIVAKHLMPRTDSAKYETGLPKLN